VSCRSIVQEQELLQRGVDVHSRVETSTELADFVTPADIPEQPPGRVACVVNPEMNSQRDILLHTPIL
jgi:hypothetical protein